MDVSIKSSELHCDICDVRFSGVSPAEQHFRSKKHARRAQELENSRYRVLVPNPSSTTDPKKVNFANVHSQFTTKQPGGCNLCDVTYTSINHARQHEEGKNHRKKRNIASFLKVDTVSEEPQQIENHSTLKNEQKMNGMLEPCAKRFKQDSNEDETDALSKNHLTRNGKYWCSACCCNLDTLRMFEIHCESPRHRNKESTSQSMQGKSMVPHDLYCEVCNCYVTSVDQLRSHKDSLKHKKKENRVKMIVWNSNVLENDELSGKAKVGQDDNSYSTRKRKIPQPSASPKSIPKLDLKIFEQLFSNNSDLKLLNEKPSNDTDNAILQKYKGYLQRRITTFLSESKGRVVSNSSPWWNKCKGPTLQDARKILTDGIIFESSERKTKDNLANENMERRQKIRRRLEELKANNMRTP